MPVKVIDTPLCDLVLVEAAVFRDDRGSFQRMHCNDTFEALGLPCQFTQSSIVVNRQANILRGMHYQVSPSQEDKLVRCVQGSILDVVIDIRKNSPTFGKYFSVKLDAVSAQALMVPRGFAHGYLTLEEGSIVVYHVSNNYDPGAEAGIRWNDPFFAIRWPVLDPVLSEKDMSWEDFSEERAL